MKIDDGLSDPQSTLPETDPTSRDCPPQKNDLDGDFPIEPTVASNTPPVHIDPPPPPGYK